MLKDDPDNLSNDEILALADHYDRKIENILIKNAQTAINMGDPAMAGKSIADIVRFLMKRVPPDKRGIYTQKLRKKIWDIDELTLSSKKLPASASMGQSITFIKTILIGHRPFYIRDVLSSIVKNLY